MMEIFEDAQIYSISSTSFGQLEENVIIILSLDRGLLKSEMREEWRGEAARRGGWWVRVRS